MYFFLTFDDISSWGSRIKWMNEKRRGEKDTNMGSKVDYVFIKINFVIYNLIVRLKGRALLFFVNVVDHNVTSLIIFR